MNGLSNLSKVVLIAVAAAIIIVLAIVYGMGGSGNNPAPGNNNTSTAGAVAASATSTTQTPPTATSTAIITAPPQKQAGKTAAGPQLTIIHFITPVAGDVWAINTQNLISWSKPGNISGALSLFDAGTNQFVGVILPQVGPNQSSYTWNTRDLLLSRTSPLKKDVTPGVYEIRLAYDGNNVAPATSAPFTITN